MTTADPIADRAAFADALVTSAIAAGEAIMAVYRGTIEVAIKADASPVTAADAAAEAIILADLARIAPGVPVVAEEEAAAGRVPTCGDRFLLVDPLDGTKEFVRRDGDFTVNIALIEHCAPTLGVVLAPARGIVFVGDVVRETAWTGGVAVDGTVTGRRAIGVRDVPAEGLAAIVSKSHAGAATDAYLERLPVAARVSCGSSLKFCLVADGAADIYPRLTPTMEWDTAAGDAVLRAAGGAVHGVDGGPLRYAKPRHFNPGFVACGRVAAPPVAPFLAD